MDSKIVELVQTDTDLDIFSRELDLLNDSLYKSEKMKIMIRPATQIWFDSLPTQREERAQALEDARQSLHQINFFKLTVAFVPSQLVISEWVGWLRKNIDPQIVMQVATERSILGAAVIEYQGKYLDLSLRKKLDQLL